MKNKIIIALTACLFSAGTIINIHLAQNDHNMDFSLADISVMALEDPENPGGGGFKYCYTAPKLGGIVEIIPCVEYNGGYLPPYRCGVPIGWCWPGGDYEQCVDQWF